MFGFFSSFSERGFDVNSIKRRALAGFQIYTSLIGGVLKVLKFAVENY